VQDGSHGGAAIEEGIHHRPTLLAGGPEHCEREFGGLWHGQSIAHYLEHFIRLVSNVPRPSITAYTEMALIDELDWQVPDSAGLRPAVLGRGAPGPLAGP
jgi:hypothetical protein